jgi:probable phosphoglycerate mutase
MTDAVGKVLTGRSPGVHLNAQGRLQAERLAERLASEPIDQIHSSPLERAQETAAPLAARLKLAIQTSDALDEVEFGDWTHRSLDGLAADATWRQFNSFRSGTRIPGGESMIEIQARMTGALEHLHREFPGRTLALFSHGDPIKATVAYYLGVPLDLFLRIEIGCASVSIIELTGTGPRVHCVNAGWREPF